jgi:hypothetical protein
MADASSSTRPISISITKEGKKLSAENRKKFDAICATDPDSQAKTFLKAFMRDYLQRVDEILGIAEDFKSSLPKSIFEVPEGTDPCYEMDELEAHKFLEKNGETMTVRDLRAAIADIDINKNFKVGLIEFLLFKFEKSVDALLDGLENAQSLPHLEEALEKAIEECKKVMAEKKAKEAEMARLQEIADKGGVKGMAAKATLAQMLAADKLEENRREIQAAANQRKAKKQLEEGGKDAVDKALQDAKKEKEEAERKKKEESRAKLAARAAMFGGVKK